MKLRRATSDSFEFQFSAREQELLQEVLRLYPLVPATHHRLSRGETTQSTENQRLLEESLAEQRATNRRRVEALLGALTPAPNPDQPAALKLKAAEMECLLQVLNDVRVGSWLALGEPDETKLPEINAENFRYAVAMEVCGAFESVLLAALGQTESPDWLDPAE